MDAGDTIQDNAADIFLGNDEVHPMVQAINALNYDVVVTGNHEYNYGKAVVKKTIADFNCKVLTGNVYDETGEPLADGYTILEKDGVRIAIIGMVTPNIAHWDPALHQKAVEMISAGELVVPSSEDGRGFNARAITEYDIR